MKRIESLTLKCLVVTIAIFMSCGNYLIADETEDTIVPEETVTEESEDFDESLDEDVVEASEMVQDESCFTGGSVIIDGNSFPDEVFRNYVSQNLDASGDGVLSEQEINDVYWIAYQHYDNNKPAISDLTGIGVFVNLRHLDVSGNTLTSIDVSNNLNLEELSVGSNLLTGIDVSNNFNLKSLAVGHNPITSLNVSNNPYLEYLFAYNCQLTSIDVSNNPQLIRLDIGNYAHMDGGNNNFRSLVVSNNPNLESLYVQNCALESLDVSNNTKLKTLEAYNNSLTSISFGNNPDLVNLYIYGNSINRIDISGCTSMIAFFDNPTYWGYNWDFRRFDSRVGYYRDVGDGITAIISWDTITTIYSANRVFYAPDSSDDSGSGVNMYRLYNPNSGEHFYTSSTGERDMLIGVGWTYECIGWVAPNMSNVPVYRLYNENGGEHHYTTSVAERDMLVSLGWNDEGIGWYSDDAQTVPLYRQYNPNAFANNHNYTTSVGENDWLVSIGWRAEGIGWYGVG